jgi:hypothetical protein
MIEWEKFESVIVCDIFENQIRSKSHWSWRRITLRLRLHQSDLAPAPQQANKQITEQKSSDELQVVERHVYALKNLTEQNIFLF